jgi:hypothetical protein
MEVTLAKDTSVRLKKGTVVDVSEAEAKRLKAFHLAEECVAPKQTKKRAAK